MARRLLFAGICALAMLGFTPMSARAETTVTGAGSTWSQVAVDQWRADVARFGLKINYQGVGSSAGRSFYIQDQTDFAVSEIPFEPNETDALRSKGKQFVYLPIVAGGTSLMYNLRDASNNPITTLRLSSALLIGIFTGSIKNWSDPALRSENPSLQMPDQTIVPVVRSDGSGTSAQFTAYLSKMEQGRWCEFARSQGIGCGYTSNYPNFGGSVAQSGSDGVANYVHSESTGRGAITYVEAAYALQRGRPVAFLRNQSGNYTLPTSSNVSTALQKATLNSDRTQNLDQVYVDPDASAYAMSSYSYMIAPTNNFPADKGDALGRFMAYFACEGQRKADLLGYSPLPRNLVEVVFDAIRQVPGAPAPPPIEQCNNPTINGSGGGTSNSTADALSGGASSTGTAPSVGQVTAPSSSIPAGSGAKGGTAGAGSTTAGPTATLLPDGTYATVGPDGQPVDPLAAGSSAQALPRVGLAGGGSCGMPLMFAALVLVAVVFGPPLWAATVLPRLSKRKP